MTPTVALVMARLGGIRPAIGLERPPDRRRSAMAAEEAGGEHVAEAGMQLPDQPEDEIAQEATPVRIGQANPKVT